MADAPNEPDRSERLERLYEQALALRAEARAGFLDEACRGDPELREELASLLEASEAGEEFLGALGRVMDASSATNPPPRLVESLAGRYAITHEIGHGGMATVYLADDLRHKRKVAVKVLRPELAAILGAERFLAEIKTTANLQHPHILPLFDSGEAEGFLYYVMPYLEGESLRERLDREHQLPVDEAVRIATDVAEALDYAHRHGVIHRDIKPANVLIHDGQPVVSDFGIALALSSASGHRLTETGLSLGTPHYMSPEHASGHQHVGPPTDIWALGCVLYEMLAGEPPYTGSTPQAILGGIIKGEAPSTNTERSSVPLNVDAAIRKALEKLPADRFTGAQAFAAALADPGFRHGASSGAKVGPDSRGLSRWNRVAAVVVATAAALAAFQLGRITTSSSSERRVHHQRVVLGGGVEPIPALVSRYLALAPDGSGILFGDTVGGPGRSYWWKPRDRPEAVRIPNMDGAEFPVFSPDGRSVAYLVNGQLRRQPLRGGGTVLLADSLNLGSTPAVAWLADGTILFGNLGPVLERVSEDGEDRAVVSDRIGGPIHVSGLLDYGGALVSTCPTLACFTNPLFLVDLERDTVQALADDVLRAWHVPGGRVVYVDRRGAVFTARLDVDRLHLGPPEPLFDGVETAYYRAEMAVGRNGTALYLAGSAESNRYVPVWVDREGNSEPIDPDWVVYGNSTWSSLALSPDDSRLAFSDLQGNARFDLYIKQLPTGPAQRLTFEGTYNRRPTWSSDGDTLTFLRRREDRGSEIRRARSDGTGESRMVLDSDQLGREQLNEALYSPDGRWLVYRVGSNTDNSNPDIFALEVGADRVPRPLVATRFLEWEPALSPDGRWLAYVSNETGRQEVYVRPFPDVDSAKWPVSLGGGFHPVWSHSGDELFYVNGAGELVRVDVTGDTMFAFGEEETLFGMRGYLVGPGNGHPRYDVTSDDQRFVMLRRVEPTAETANVRRLFLVENFFEELKRLVSN